MYAAVLLAALLAGNAEELAARQSQAFEARLLAELEAIAPGAVPEARAAGEAYRASRWQEAFDGYARVLAAAPGFPHAVRRQCTARRELGDREGALPLCRAALRAAATPENQLSLALTLLAVPGPAGPPGEAMQEAGRLGRAALAGAGDDLPTVTGLCQVALLAGDRPLLVDCAGRLQRLAPGELASEYFSFVAAMVQERRDDAHRHLAAARAAGLPEEQAARLEQAIEEATPPLQRWGWPALAVLAGWAALLALLLGAGALLSSATLRGARRLATAEGRTVAAPLRRIYGVVLWLTCAVYYASLPLVVLAVGAVGAGVFLAFDAVGSIPVNLLLILGITVLVTLMAVLKSLWVSVVRPRGGDPGPRLDVAAHPRFGAALRQAAERVGTRPVDTVFLTPGTDMAVFERGGLLRRLTGRTERCLVAGVGLLDGLHQGQLKAILAHEYGHFVNRDTAGGGLALAVRRSVLEMGRALAEGGAATWYNPAWHFVNGFHRVFLRVSQGASRLQEILADRWAALAYGGRAFAGGLSHVVARDARFDRHADAVLKEVIEGSKGLANLYRYAPATPVDEQAVDEAVAQAMSAEPSPYDSHPRPADRIAWVGDLAGRHGAGIDDGAPAWDLFEDREALERRLTDEVRAIVAARHGVEIPLEDPAPQARPAEAPSPG